MYKRLVADIQPAKCRATPLVLDSLNSFPVHHLNDYVTSTDLFSESIGALFDSYAAETAPGSQLPILYSLLLPILSAMLGPGIRAGIGPRNGTWNECIRIWAANSAATGSGKTPAMHAISQALEYTQEIVRAFYKSVGLPDDRLPSFIATAKTLEKLIVDLSNAADGTQVKLVDELTQLVTGLNQYKGGGGNDMELLLELKSGTIQRHSTMGNKDPIIVRYPHLLIAGGLQPDTFRTHFLNERAESNGLAGRIIVFHAGAKEKSPGKVVPMVFSYSTTFE